MEKMKAINVKPIMSAGDKYRTVREECGKLTKAIDDALMAEETCVCWKWSWISLADANTELDRIKAKRGAARAELIERSAKLQGILDYVQCRSKVRTIEIDDIINALAEIENKLSLPKKAMIGVSAWVDVNAQKFPTAYRGIPESTQFHAEYTTGGWKILSVVRYRCTNTKVEITHTEASKEALIQRFSKF